MVGLIPVRQANGGCRLRSRPPGKDPSTAEIFILAHLLMILLLEPLMDAFEDSSHWPKAA